MQILAAAFNGVGVQSGDVVCQFADNSSRWLLADQGIMLNGAINAVRSAKASAEELAQIMEVTRPKGLVVQDKGVLQRIAPKLRAQAHKPAFVVLLWGGEPGTGDLVDMPIFSFEEVCVATRCCTRIAVRNYSASCH
jgi:long-chain acyl-CoA synthetase